MSELGGPLLTGLGISPISPRQARFARDAMRTIGAVSPATARPWSEIPMPLREDFELYVHAGVIREGSPGTFCLFDHENHHVPRRHVLARIVGAILFWILVVLIPVAIISFTG
jgi:hypothetical protein